MLGSGVRVRYWSNYIVLVLVLAFLFLVILPHTQLKSVCMGFEMAGNYSTIGILLLLTRRVRYYSPA